MIFFETIDELKSGKAVGQSSIPGFLETETNGCSASVFFRLGDTYVLKINDTARDWLSLRGNDSGREVWILKEMEGSALWDIFDSPYIAAAHQDTRYGLLMQNLDGFLFGNDSSYDGDLMNGRVIQSLAQMHAAFWENPKLARSHFLLSQYGYFSIIGPSQRYKDTEQFIGKAVLKGWDAVSRLIPERTLRILQSFGANVKRYTDLPRTFTHGDFRPTNLGYNTESGKLVIIDFAFCGFAPCTVDLYWYLATTSWCRFHFDEVIALYEDSLQQVLGPIGENDWKRLHEVGLLTACCMQLWEKALNYEKDTDDFIFWVDKLHGMIADW